MSVFRKRTTRHFLDGKRVKAGTPGAEPVTEHSKKWYGRLPGETRARPLSRNKGVALSMYADLLRQQERKKGGLHSEAQDWRQTPLEDHLADFRLHVQAGRKGARRPPCEQAVELVMGRLRAVLDGCGFAFAQQINLPSVQAYLASLTRAEPVAIPDRETFTVGEVAELLGCSPATVRARRSRLNLPKVGGGHATRCPRETVVALAECHGRGLGLTTVAEYAAVLRRFTRWLVRRGRLGSDPLADLEIAAPEHDGRRQRRPLTPAEMGRFLSVTLDSARTYRGLSGADRHALYLTALSTGFRASELAALTPARFLLDATPPVVLLAESESKNDRGAVQPLPAGVVGVLRAYLEGRDPDSPVWPGDWPEAAAVFLRRDLAEAGVACRVQGPDGPLFVDFHALRHSFVASLKRAGVTLSQAMRLARHSDPKLTLKVYGREDLDELAGAVGRIDPAGASGCTLVAPEIADGQGRRGKAKEGERSRPGADAAPARGGRRGGSPKGGGK